MLDKNFISNVDEAFAIGANAFPISEEEWQTLKTAVLAQQSTNSAMDAICAHAEEYASLHRDAFTKTVMPLFVAWVRKQHQ